MSQMNINQIFSKIKDIYQRIFQPIWVHCSLLRFSVASINKFSFYLAPDLKTV